jgi:hypothetical protein
MWMDTDVRVQTAIEARALGLLTPLLILAIQTVVVSVTACVRRQAQTRLADTAVVGVGTGVVHHGLEGVKAVSVEVDDDGWIKSCLHIDDAIFEVTVSFIRLVETVRLAVTQLAVFHALSIETSEVWARGVNTKGLIRLI